jgi:hypothetical protein
MIILFVSERACQRLPGTHADAGTSMRDDTLVGAPHVPDFLPSLVVSTGFMRLSSMKAAHAAVDKAA